MNNKFKFLEPHIVETLKSISKKSNESIIETRMYALESLAKTHNVQLIPVGEKPNGCLFKTQEMSNGNLRIFISSSKGIHNYATAVEIINNTNNIT